MEARHRSGDARARRRRGPHLARARWTEQHAWGIGPRLPIPPPLLVATAVTLMDCALYWWHVLLHRVPALWRVHEPHHIDRDLEASTRSRQIEER